MEFLKNYKFWNVVIIVVLSIIAIYLLVFFVSLALSLKYKKNLQNKNLSLLFNLSQRYEIILSIVERLCDAKVIIPGEVLNLLKKSPLICLNSCEEDENRKIVINALSELFIQLSKLASTNNVVIGDLSKSIAEAEDFYRQKFASYNLDVIAYNYWCYMFGCRHIFKKFGLTKKELLK